MACFTKTQQCNGTNCEFEKYVTTSNIFVLDSLDKCHLNSVCTQYVCDKSENARVCAKWLWNALNWCYWIALPASPVVQSSNTVSCVSLSFRTNPCVLAIKFLLLRFDHWSPNCYKYLHILSQDRNSLGAKLFNDHLDCGKERHKIPIKFELRWEIDSGMGPKNFYHDLCILSHISGKCVRKGSSQQ